MRFLFRWRWTGPSLILMALPFGLPVLAVSALAQSESRYLEQSPVTGYNATAPVPFWRKITLGSNKGVDAYRDALDAASIKIGDAANEILGRPAFPYARTKINLELVLLSVAELGMEGEAVSLSDVYKRARQAGFELCPAEVGPQLRLDYRDQPLREAVHIAMAPIATYHGELTILALTNFGGQLSLLGSDGRPHFMMPQTFRFVFSVPSTQRREVVKHPSRP